MKTNYFKTGRINRKKITDQVFNKLNIFYRLNDDCVGLTNHLDSHIPNFYANWR